MAPRQIIRNRWQWKPWKWGVCVTPNEMRWEKRQLRRLMRRLWKMLGEDAPTKRLTKEWTD